MSKLIRHFNPGQSCFITSVTARRNPILVQHADLLLEAIKRALNNFEFKIFVWVILPDHFHIIINVPNGDTSKIIKSIKLSFSGQFKSKTGKKGSIWHHRYWDHITRDEKNMNKHINYIHYNPVKHELVDSPKEYRFSSFRKFYRDGLYDWNWMESEKSGYDNEYGE
jgi:REP-associated tyrosine transposase